MADTKRVDLDSDQMFQGVVYEKGQNVEVPEDFPGETTTADPAFKVPGGPAKSTNPDDAGKADGATATVTEQEGDQEAPADMTVDELKAELDAANVEYKSSANKSELVAAVEELRAS